LLSTVYPFWFLIFCLLIGAAYALLLYAKNYFRTGKSMLSYPSWIMLSLRFVVISLICFFMLSPFIKKYFKKEEKPMIVLALDNSASVLLNKDSTTIKESFPGKIEDLKNKLAKKYRVVEYSFGEEVNENSPLDFQESRTNMYQMFDYIYEQHFNNHLGAVILASDGNYNQGADPFSLINDFKIPFYCIALGDTSPQADLKITEIQHNEIAYLGNIIPIRFQLDAKKFKNQVMEVSLEMNQKSIKKWSINIERNDFNHIIDYQFEATRTGLQNFVLKIKEKDGEISYENNSKSFVIDVIESRKNILIIANSPHPDVKAIKRSLEKNDNYQVHSVLAENIKSQTSLLEKTDLVILHQLPSKTNPLSQEMTFFEKNKTPLYIVLGKQTSFSHLNQLNLGLQIQHQQSAYEEVLAIPNSSFNYFSFDDDFATMITNYPPLVSPFGKYNLQLENQVLFTQKIGAVKSAYPLAVYLQDVDKRTGFICGEGIWRWPLMEYKLSQKEKSFDAFILKSVQYLSVKEDRRFFYLKNFKNTYAEDENIKIDAELYDKNYEKLKGANIKLELFYGKQKKSFSFIENETGYAAVPGYLKPGNYTFTASTTSSGKLQKIEGRFRVKKVNVEHLQITANHQLLYNIASKNNGKMIYPDQTDQLLDMIDDLDLKQRSSFEIESRDLIDLKWFFFLIIALLSFEWFLRKFFGSY
jgi:hypothetical protein